MAHARAVGRAQHVQGYREELQPDEQRDRVLRRGEQGARCRAHSEAPPTPPRCEASFGPASPGSLACRFAESPALEGRGATLATLAFTEASLRRSASCG